MVYASPTAIRHIERHKPDFYAQVGANLSIAKQMYQYAKEMSTGEAMTFDKKLGRMARVKEIMSKEEYQRKGKEAAAWIAALQTKAGVDSGTIRTQLTDPGIGNFNAGEISEIIAAASKTGSEELKKT